MNKFIITGKVHTDNLEPTISKNGKEYIKIRIHDGVNYWDIVYFGEQALKVVDNLKFGEHAIFEGNIKGSLNEKGYVQLNLNGERFTSLHNPLNKQSETKNEWTEKDDKELEELW